MSTHRTTYKQWYANLGETVLLTLVPELLGIPAEKVTQAIRRRELSVHTFRAENDRVFRMVRLRDLQVYGKNPLTLEGMARAVAAMLHESRPPERPAA